MLPRSFLAKPSRKIARSFMRPVFHALGDHHPITAGSSLPTPGDPLLDEAAAQIGVDRSSLRPRDSLAQTHIRDVLAPGKFRQTAHFENPHATRRNTMSDSTTDHASEPN
jgi:hypothetical protein